MRSTSIQKRDQILFFSMIECDATWFVRITILTCSMVEHDWVFSRGSDLMLASLEERQTLVLITDFLMVA